MKMSSVISDILSHLISIIDKFFVVVRRGDDVMAVVVGRCDASSGVNEN